MTACRVPLLLPTSWADPDGFGPGSEVAADDVGAVSTAVPDGVGSVCSEGFLTFRLDLRVFRFGPFFSSATSIGLGGGTAADEAAVEAPAPLRANLSSFLLAR